MNYAIFWDVESTSKNPLKDRIISIGAVLVVVDADHSYNSISEFSTFVHTDQAIDPMAHRVHGISANDLVNAPKLDVALASFVSFVNTHVNDDRRSLIMIAHNGSRFDDLILASNCASDNIDLRSVLKRAKVTGFADSLKLLRSLMKHKQKHCLPTSSTGRVSFALGNCYTKFCPDEPQFKAHDALEDTRALYKIFRSLKINPRLLRKHVLHVNKYMQILRDRAGLNTWDDTMYHEMAVASPSPVNRVLVPYNAQYVFCPHCLVFCERTVQVHKCTV